MTTLVVKYLKDRYSAGWKELTAKATENIERPAKTLKISHLRGRSI